VPGLGGQRREEPGPWDVAAWHLYAILPDCRQCACPRSVVLQ